MKILSWFDFINNLPSGKVLHVQSDSRDMQSVLILSQLGNRTTMEPKKVPLRRIIHFIGSENQGTDLTSDSWK